LKNLATQSQVSMRTLSISRQSSVFSRQEEPRFVSPSPQILSGRYSRR
jgi:hypothetical protein